MDTHPKEDRSAPSMRIVDKISVTPEELAQITPLGENRIRELCRTDPTFRCYKNGRCIVIPLEGFREWEAVQAEMKVGFPEYIHKRKRR